MAEINIENIVANDGQRKIVKCLKRYIRERGPNALMPSFRSLSKMCRVSPLTVSDVVSDFSAKGLLVVIPRKGIYSAENLPKEILDPEKLERVDVVMVEAGGTQNNPPAFHQEMAYQLGQQPCILDLDVRLHRTTPGPNEALKLRKVASDPGCQGIIISKLSSLDQLIPFEDALIPYICVYPESHELPPNRSVMIDIEELVSSQIEHLTSLGHSRIGYLHNVNPAVFHHSNLLRRETFFRLALDRKLNIDSSIVKYGGFGPDEQKRGARAILSATERPTAIICNDEHLPAVYSIAGECGLDIGKDLSVVGTNNIPASCSVTPQASTLEIPRAKAVQLALEMLKKAHATPDGIVANEYVKTELIQRQSTGHI